MNHQVRHGYLHSQGINYYAFVIPNKEVVYSEFLPEDIPLSENRIIRRCENEIKKHNLSYFNYFVNDLYSTNHDMETYRKGDTHWNQYGAFIYYRKIIEVINKEIKTYSLSKDNITFKKVNIEGDLINKISEDSFDEDIIGSINDKQAELTYTNNVHNTGSLRIYENKVYTGYPTAIIFRDSFTTWMEHYIAESFSKVVFVHQSNLDYKYIEENKPDIVCSIQIERFAAGVPSDVLGPLQSQNEAKKNANQ